MNSYLSRLCKEKKTSVFFWVRLVQETADAIKEKWRGKQLRLGGVTVYHMASPRFIIKLSNIV